MNTIVGRKVLIRRDVRGVSFVDTRMFTQDFRDTLAMLVTNFQAPFRLVNAKFEGQVGGLVFGKKFNDVDQVVDRILRTISSEYALWENPIPKNVEDVEREERLHLGVWAWEGLRDSADSDHWYMYEKRYD